MQTIQNGNTIPITYSRLLARHLELKENSLERLLRGTELSPKCLIKEDKFITAAEQEQIITNALQVSNDPFLALHLGKMLVPLTHGPLGLLISSCQDLAAALNAFEEFLPTRMNFVRIEPSRQNSQLLIQMHCFLDTSDAIAHFVIEVLSQELIKVIESVTGETLTEGIVSFNFEPPEKQQLFTQQYGMKVVFNAETNCLSIPQRLLSTHNAMSNSDGYDFALRQCIELKKMLPKQDSLTNKLTSIMFSHSPGEFSERDAANALFVSVKTLERRLAKEGTCFRVIKAKVLSELAGKYLRDSDLPIGVIAHYLNYHDSSNFRRAFKGWFSMTPQEYRRQK